METGASGENGVPSSSLLLFLRPAQNSVVVLTGAGDVGSPNDPMPKKMFQLQSNKLKNNSL